MKCIHCSEYFDVSLALETSPFSWPLRQTIWHECISCRTGNHIRIEKGLVRTIKLLGSPGNEYETIETEIEPTAELRVDLKYLHIWLKGNHYEIKERE